MAGKRATARQRAATEKQSVDVAAPAAANGLALPAMLISGWLLAAAIFLAALGGGILYDRVLSGGPAGPFELIGTPLATILVALGLALAFWSSRESQGIEPNRPARAALVISALFIGWCALSLVHSSYLHSSLASLSLFAVSVMAAVLAFRAARSLDSALLLAALGTAAATLVSAIGINEYMRELRGGNSLWRVFAGFVNPDFLAGYLVMAVPVAVVLLLAARRPAARMAAGTAVLLESACLVLTGSRLGLLTLVASLAALAVMTFRGRLLSGPARRVALIAAGLLMAGIVVASRPLLRRVLSSGTESYSAQFRTRTWRGTERMAAANPLLGTGVGTFETAYGPYAEVGYTQHAHNAYLQLAGETGFPGALLFAALIGIVLVTGASGVRPPPEDTQDDTTRRLLTAGLASAVVAAALHNLSDSDLYVPANCLMLGTWSGLLLAVSKHGAAAHSDSPLWSRALTAIAAVALTANALMVLTGRIAANGAEIDSASAFVQAPPDEAAAQSVRSSLVAAIQGFRDAESRDPLNPDYPLKLAPLLEATGDRPGAEAESRRAIDRARIGKTYYRYGKLLAREGKWAEAAATHEQVRRIEPNNLDNLLALADADMATSRPARAEEVWRRMVELARSDFGRIRAVPEMVEWQYGRAYEQLGQAELQRGETERAAADLKEAVGILGTFWKQRDLLIAQIRVRTDERRRTADYYADSLAAYEKALSTLGRTADADKVKAAAAAFIRERADFDKKP